MHRQRVQELQNKVKMYKILENGGEKYAVCPKCQQLVKMHPTAADIDKQPLTEVKRRQIQERITYATMRNVNKGENIKSIATKEYI
jgi:hypothetical protein